MKNIQLLEVKSEIGAGTRGASLGPDAIKIAALDFNSKYFKKYPTEVIPDENHFLLQSTKTPYAKRIEGIVKMYDRISKKVSSTLKAGKFPIILSADHSNAGGSIAGVKMTYPDERIGVIWIDAHADLHTPYTTPSGNVHGMPLATALAEDNLEQKVNDPDEKTVNYWNEMKNTGGISPKIKAQDLVFFVVRDIESQENHLINKYRIKNFALSEIRKKGIEKVAQEAFKKLKDCDKIYISFDVDSMDSRISKGTGTPVPNGLTEKEAGNLLTRLVQNEKVCCLEITEVNPTLDKENLMAENTFEILQKVTSEIAEG